MNPYEADPDNIPAGDSHAAVPFYGRYLPRPDDFHVDSHYINSKGPEALRYCESVLDLCDKSNRIYVAHEGGRDVFAVGSVIVKSSHLHKTKDEIDYSYADANEVKAVALAAAVLEEVRVPEIHFTGKVNGRQVIVQERIPGVGLDVAWPYLSLEQKKSFKKQARNVLRQLCTVEESGRGHMVKDPNIETNGRISSLEREIMSSDSFDDLDTSFMHNDFTLGNIIVDHDTIVGLIDWDRAGFFGWKKAGEVHRRVRSPQKEQFADSKLSEEKLKDLMWWNDLYDEGMPEFIG